MSLGLRFVEKSTLMRFFLLAVPDRRSIPTRGIAAVDACGAASVATVPDTLDPAGNRSRLVVDESRPRRRGAPRQSSAALDRPRPQGCRPCPRTGTCATAIREDGTIPRPEKPSWQDLDKCRASAQIEGGEACNPSPPG
jgi:hypothetical protein